MSTNSTTTPVNGVDVTGEHHGRGGWFRVHRSAETLEILKDPLALALLMLVAYRARFKIGFSVDGLEQGEARVGDFHIVGMSRQQYRDRLNKLVRWGFLTIRATNKGTIAKLTSSAVFDIGSAPVNQQSNLQRTNGQPSRNHQGTTNIEGIERENEQNANIRGGGLGRVEPELGEAKSFLTFEEFVRLILPVFDRPPDDHLSRRELAFQKEFRVAVKDANALVRFFRLPENSLKPGVRSRSQKFATLLDNLSEQVALARKACPTPRAKPAPAVPVPAPPPEEDVAPLRAVVPKAFAGIRAAVNGHAPSPG